MKRSKPLRGALDELTGAETLPWSPTRTAAHRIMFEEMAGKLPDEERDALMEAFTAQLRRLRIIVD